jgi:hypothetical protein
MIEMLEWNAAPTECDIQGHESVKQAFPLRLRLVNIWVRGVASGKMDLAHDLQHCVQRGLS